MLQLNEYDNILHEKGMNHLGLHFVMEMESLNQ